MQYRQDVRHIAHYQNRKKTSLPIHVAQKITVICGQKIWKSSVWNLKLCSGAICRRREKSEHGCTTTYHPYKQPPKHIFKLHGLIDFQCAQTLALPCAFGTTTTSWQFYCGTLYGCREIFLYGCTSTIYGVQVGTSFLSSHFWMVEVVPTNFAPILSDFDNFLGHYGTYHSGNFQICLLHWKGIFFPEKTLQTASKSA